MCLKLIILYFFYRHDDHFNNMVQAGVEEFNTRLQCYINIFETM